MKRKIIASTILAFSTCTLQGVAYGQKVTSNIEHNDDSKNISDKPGTASSPSTKSKTSTRSKSEKLADDAQINRKISAENKKLLEELAAKVSISPSMKVYRKGAVLMVEFNDEPSRIIPNESFATLPEGARYLGYAKDEKGLLSGIGILVYEDHTIFEGSLKSGKKKGLGKITHPDGSILAGVWENDKFVRKIK